ncbi:DUF803-domain-containing protein [Dendrothele bispora CBS 962.96]|uniref:DUF803-domain-containing protein n=1 Tax=Dendrothele bispora (strain CBS 962.96) TaxID=1314807 RepID=A0A4S8MVK3_DENBC|nr:DUF803-domain-containing protein [Dendrothele bispora CBS 962.96]
MPVDDKWIGLALAISSSAAIGMSYIITKKGLNTAGAYGQAASDNLSYLRNPIWWAGISTLANFAAYTFAPPILVTPLGALSVLIGAVLASFLLNEELGHLGRVGCTLSLLGSLIIVLHAPEDKEVETVDEILNYAAQPGFLLYIFTVIVFSLVMIYAIVPRYGRTTPLVYVSICSMVGSVSVMAIKGFGVALKLTFAGKNQFVRPSTYVFGVVSAVCILIQMNYLNKALDTFSVNIVNAMYYVGFSTATIVASLILFQGFNTTDTTNTVSLLCGFIVTFLGVHILNLSRLANNPQDRTQTIPAADPLSNRLSVDGWLETGLGSGGGGGGMAPRSARGHGQGHGHGRRTSSVYRSQGSATLFSAFEGENEEEQHPLHRLGEEEEHESDTDEDVSEMTGLTRSGRDRSSGGRKSGSGSRTPRGGPGGGGGSRSHSSSRSPSVRSNQLPMAMGGSRQGSLGDVRITPRQV